jgi:hypothetical protein
MLNSIQHSFNIGYKALAGGAGIDPHAEFRDFDRGSHASHHPDREVFLRCSPEDVAYRLTVFEQLSIDKTVATGRTDRRNN